VFQCSWFLQSCVGCRCPGAGSGVAGRGRDCPRPDTARSSQSQPAPTVPPQGTAQPCSRGGGASVITHLRKGKKGCAAAVRDKSERNIPADPKVRGGGGEVTTAPISHPHALLGRGEVEAPGTKERS